MRVVKRHRIQLVCAVISISLLGCVEGAGSSDVSGAILGSTFDAIGGSAESEGDGFTITIADSTAFGCGAFGVLPESYLTVVIGTITGPTTLGASGVVYFNSFEDGISSSEAATSGSVTIDLVDTELNRIEGYVDASGDTSSVAGSFAVDICN